MQEPVGTQGSVFRAVIDELGFGVEPSENVLFLSAHRAGGVNSLVIGPSLNSFFVRLAVSARVSTLRRVPPVPRRILGTTHRGPTP